MLTQQVVQQALISFDQSGNLTTVATGNYPQPELAACGPDFLFGDFSDVGRVVQALCGS